VAISTVVDWVRVWRDSGSLAAKPMGGDHSSRLKSERAWLLERIAAVPDLTLRNPGRTRRSRIRVGYGQCGAFFAAEGISFKKIVHAPSKSGLTSLRRAPPG